MTELVRDMNIIVVGVIRGIKREYFFEGELMLIG